VYAAKWSLVFGFIYDFSLKVRKKKIHQCCPNWCWLHCQCLLVERIVQASIFISYQQFKTKQNKTSPSKPKSFLFYFTVQQFLFCIFYIFKSCCQSKQNPMNTDRIFLAFTGQIEIICL